MGLTNAGRDFMAGALMGDEATLFDNANAYIGVGNSNTAFNATQTDLQGASKVRKGMEATYPLRDPESGGDDNKIRFKATFGSAEGNFAWEEWGVFNAAAAGIMLNRLVDAQGTKVSGATWVFEVDITVQIGS